jgi:hypothetical protein
MARESTWGCGLSGELIVELPHIALVILKPAAQQALPQETPVF